ncbi:MAG: hypothetical protein DSZ07_08200 [Sulfurovum sp.]|nr:MAG: hypothetical protein DSZ07_08200 [Sulfurovum sp.]
MKKLILPSLFLFSSLLLAENNLSDEFQYQQIIENTLSTIDTNSFALPLPDKEKETSIFPSYNEALAKAKEEDKVVLLEVILDNCKFCEKMGKEVLSKENVQEAIAKKFVFAQINASREPLPLNLSEQMSPMFVFVSKSENVKDMRFGYINENDFLNLLVEESSKK